MPGAAHSNLIIVEWCLQLIIIKYKFIFRINIKQISNKYQINRFYSNLKLHNNKIDMDFKKFVQDNQDSVCFTELFNEQHASLIFEQQLQKKPHFTKVYLNNVGIKIMNDFFQKFQEQGIDQVIINYNWNDIMMFPKLVCYDKNTWKTLQQLANWNKQWEKLFNVCFSIKKVTADITCSWADSQNIKAFLQGITRLPNVSQVNVTIKSKCQDIQNLLSAFQSANIFPSFCGKYVKF